MSIRRVSRRIGGVAVMFLFVGLTIGAPLASADSGRTDHRGDHGRDALYVAPVGSSHGSERGCRRPDFTSISAAVAAAPSGGTVIVCEGTYNEDVLVNKPLTLTGRDATIDATGLENGIQVVASDVWVGGFTLENANGEGLLVGIDALTDIGLLPSTGPVLDHVTAQDNNAVNNDKGFNGTETGNCKYPGDCGGGIHFNGTTHSFIRGNRVKGNADGVLLTDDYAPSSHNVIAGNIVNDNLSECGIVLPSHATNAVTFDPSTFAVTARNPMAGGIYDNLVVGNIADDNGTNTAPPQFGGGGSGSGIGLFGSGPGSAVYDNVVTGNEASGNGLAGIAMHAHTPGGEDINGNVLTFNRLGTNNIGGDGFDGPPTTDFQTTGIAIFSIPTAQMTIAHNFIHDDTYGIWLSKTITANGLGSNFFHNVGTHVFAG